MIKYYGIGVAVLLAVSGISQAHMVGPSDGHLPKLDDKDHGLSFKIDEKPCVAEEIKHLEMDIKKDKMLLMDLKHDLKLDKFDDFGKDDKDCWKPEMPPICGHGHDSDNGACSVPLPASSAMGGIGAAAVALMTWVRSRKASVA